MSVKTTMDIPPYIVEDILRLAIRDSTAIGLMRLSSVNKFTKSFLTPEVRKRALLEKLQKIVRTSKCEKNSIKLLRRGVIEYELMLRNDRVRLLGPLVNVECNRKRLSEDVKLALYDLINKGRYNKVRVNKKDMHEDMMKLARIFTAAI